MNVKYYFNYFTSGKNAPQGLKSIDCMLYNQALKLTEIAHYVQSNFLAPQFSATVIRQRTALAIVKGIH